jgi:RNA polymerase sigma-70 factor (ECF subfamily)
MTVQVHARSAVRIAFEGITPMLEPASARGDAPFWSQPVAAIAAARDQTAFRRLFGHFGPRVKAYLMRTGSDAAQAEDLVQEVMASVWRRAETFDPRQSNVGTWIFTIARNKRIDAFRRERRPEIDWNDPLLVPGEEPGADEGMELEQTAKRVKEALKLLPPEQAALLKMAFYEDKSHSVIAAESGLPLGTVKSRLRLAFAKLRQSLRDER